MSKRLIWACAPALCAFAVAAPAQAKSERIVSGHASVRPSLQITMFLRARGITVTPIGAMKIGNGSLSMPMAGGHMNVPSMRGTMVMHGGLEYSNGAKHVRVHGYRLIHAGHVAKLTAVVNGRRLLIATMSASMKLSGKAATMTGGLKLSAAWARLINHLVGQHVVHAGEDLGDLTATMKMA